MKYSKAMELHTGAERGHPAWNSSSVPEGINNERKIISVLSRMEETYDLVVSGYLSP